jgi:hypothetical protein
MTTTALPLSQKILHWLAVALGYGEDYFPGFHTSWSTFKNAGNDQVLHCWDGLVQDSAWMLGMHVTPDQLKRLRAGLRAWDRQVSQLEDFGLPLQDRMVAVLRLAIPELGARLGAFGALALLHCPEGALAEREARVLSHPLSPSFFGDILELLLRRHRPEWKTWERRYEMLEQCVEGRRKLRQRTIERWRSKTDVVLPSPELLRPMAALIAGGDEKKRTFALGLLRYARAMTMLRRDLARWAGVLLAEQYSTATHRFAEHSMRVLLQRASVTTLGEIFITALESGRGHEALEHMVPLLGPQARDLDPGQLAKRLRAHMKEHAEDAVGQDDSWILVSQVLARNPLLLGGVGAMMRAPNTFFLALGQPMEILSGHWRHRAMLTSIASTSTLTWVSPDREEHERRIPTHLSDLARQLLAQDAIVRGPDDLPEDRKQALFWQFTLNLAALMGGPGEIQSVIESINGIDFGAYLVDPSLERALDDQQIMDLPPLMAARAARLAEEGHHIEAVEWMGRWKKSSSLRSDGERRAISQAAVAIGNTMIDKLIEPRAFLRTKLGVPTEELPGAFLERLRQSVSVVREAMQACARQAEEMLDIARAVTTDSATPREQVELMVMALPLALRIAFLRAALEPPFESHLSMVHAIVQGIEKAQKTFPNHGGLWAMLALWQRCNDEDDDFATARAEHFGCGDLLHKETSRIAEDLGLSEDDGSD